MYVKGVSSNEITFLAKYLGMYVKWGCYNNTCQSLRLYKSKLTTMQYFWTYQRKSNKRLYDMNATADVSSNLG